MNTGTANEYKYKAQSNTEEYWFLLFYYGYINSSMFLLCHYTARTFYL